MNLNRVSISGNLTRDPELRQASSGMSVLQFSVAVNDRVKDARTGEYVERPNYVECATFGNRAAALAKILRKGSKVAVDGKLRWSSWQAEDGSKRSKLEVVAESIDLMSRAPQSSADAPSPEPEPESLGGAPDLYGEDIPF